MQNVLKGTKYRTVGLYGDIAQICKLESPRTKPHTNSQSYAGEEMSVLWHLFCPVLFNFSLFFHLFLFLPSAFLSGPYSKHASFVASPPFGQRSRYLQNRILLGKIREGQRPGYKIRLPPTEDSSHLLPLLLPETLAVRVERIIIIIVCVAFTITNKAIVIVSPLFTTARSSALRFRCDRSTIGLS